MLKTNYARVVLLRKWGKERKRGKGERRGNRGRRERGGRHGRGEADQGPWSHY